MLKVRMRPELRLSSLIGYRTLIARFLIFSILIVMFFQFLVLFPKPVNNFSSITKFKKLAEGETATEGSESALALARMSQKASEQSIKGLHLVESINQQKGWELSAVEAIGSDNSQWVLKQVNVVFFSDEIATFKVRGDVGEIDGQSKNIVIRGKVVTESANGYVFETSELRFDAATKSLISDDTVVMSSPKGNTSLNTNLTGFGLRIVLPTNKIFVLDNVKAENIINGEKFSLTSRQAEFSNLSREAQFSENVQMNFREYKTTSAKANFVFDKRTNQIDRIFLSPQVEMKGTAQHGRCKLLDIYPQKDMIVMRGQPQLTYLGDQISGEEIVLTERGQKVKIRRAEMTGSNRP